MADGFRAEFAPGDLSALQRQIDQFGPALTGALRTRMRAAADELVQDMAAAVKSSPPPRARRVGGRVRGGRRTTTRADIAAGIRAVPAAGTGLQEGFTLEVSDSKLPAGRKAMAMAWNKRRWRHPVYGGPAVVTQEGRPYFDRTVKDNNANLETAVGAALDEAIEKVGL